MLAVCTHARAEHTDTEWKGQLVITELARESRLQAIYNLWAEFEAAKEMNYQISFFEDTITLRRAMVPRAHAPPDSVTSCNGTSGSRTTRLGSAQMYMHFGCRFDKCTLFGVTTNNPF